MMIRKFRESLRFIPQRNIPVAIVDDFAHQMLGAFFVSGEDLGDVPEAIGLRLTRNFLRM